MFCYCHLSQSIKGTHLCLEVYLAFLNSLRNFYRIKKTAPAKRETLCRCRLFYSIFLSLSITDENSHIQNYAKIIYNRILPPYSSVKYRFPFRQLISQNCVYLKQTSKRIHHQLKLLRSNSTGIYPTWFHNILLWISSYTDLQ